MSAVLFIAVSALGLASRAYWDVFRLQRRVDKLEREAGRDPDPVYGRRPNA